MSPLPLELLVTERAIGVDDDDPFRRYLLVWLLLGKGDFSTELMVISSISTN